MPVFQYAIYQKMKDYCSTDGYRRGLNLYYENSDVGITLMAKNTKEIIIDLNINRKTVENNRESITDIGWYFNNIIQKMCKRGCPIDSIKFEEYVD